jgi:diguanylate cyclase (GGDEF)-like protein/PAS domain S-box-containing protein
MKRRPEPDEGRPIEALRVEARRFEALESRISQLMGEHERLLGLSREMTDALAELRGAMREWEWFFEHSIEMMCIAGMDGRFKRVNPAFSAALGFSEAELVSRPFFDFIHPDDQEPTMEVLNGLGRNTDCINFENRYRDREGEWHWIAWRVPALAPGARNLYAIARDVTGQRRSEAELLHRARHDPLTGLLNRAAFEDALGDAVLRAGRYPRHELALFLVDLDGFKQVNDSRGHQAGDRLLKQVGTRLRRIAREGEMVSRIGGDEFALLIEGEADLQVESLARRIDEVLHGPDESGELEAQIGCCVGISVLPRNARDVESLFAQADEALYSVKREGGGGFRCWREVEGTAV